LKNPDVEYQANIDLPAQFVWNLLQDFGGWINFSPLYSEMTVQESAGFRPVYRDYVTVFGDSYREELVFRDKDNFTLKYKSVKTLTSNQNVETIETIIMVKPVEKRSSSLSWKSNVIFVSGTNPEVKKQIFALQKRVFKKTTVAAVTHLYIQYFTKYSMDYFTQKTLEIEAALLVGNRTHIYEYADYAEDPDRGPLPKMVKGLPKREALAPKKIGAMISRILELGYLQAAKYILEDEEDIDEKFDYEDAARKLVSTYGSEQEKEMTAALLKGWESDEEFCQQYLQGANPIQIEVIRSIDQVPLKMRSLLVQERGQFKTVQTLFQEKRLFVADYKDLQDMKLHKNKYFYAPILVLYKELLEDGDSRLNVLGIQLERNENAPIYTPQSSHKNRYKLAKYFVACADCQIHQFGYHLGISHLGNEPVIVSINRKLPPTHALRALLQPHMEDTIGINFGARLALISKAETAVTNHMFALGTDQGRKISSREWQKFDFFDWSFPKELEKRGFYRDGRDGLDNYHFRDDGFRLWDALGSYAQTFVNRHYARDEDVSNDRDVQAWAYDLSAKEFGNYPGFPSQILSKELLWKVLQIIIWNSSALHSYLNSPQWPYVGFVKNRPNALYKPMPPEDGYDITSQYINDALLPTFAALSQIVFSWFLTTPTPESSLVDLKALKEFYPDIDEKFQKELNEVAKQISKRNDKLVAQGKTPYIFLMPENVSCSANI